MDTKTRMTATRRTLLQLAAGTALMLTGAVALPGHASAEDSALKGKNLAYIAFGLQYESQVTLVEHVKKLAAEKGMNISVYDGKGDPSTQTTQMLDILSKQPDIILLNPVDAK